MVLWYFSASVSASNGDKNTTEQKQHQVVQTLSLISQNYQGIQSFREFKEQSSVR